MSEKEEIIDERLGHSGIFDFVSFYKYAHSWLKEENYGVNENKYSEKVSGNARDILIEWLATRRLSDYFKIEIKIEFEIDKLSDVEVEVDGERRKTNKGKIGMKIRGVIVKDPDSKWDTSPFYRFMRDIYNKYIIPGRVYKIEERIKSTVREFKEELKAFLEMSGRRAV